MAGTVAPNDTQAVQEAEETYVKNLKYSADECKKVKKAIA